MNAEVETNREDMFAGSVSYTLRAAHFGNKPFFISKHNVDKLKNTKFQSFSTNNTGFDYIEWPLLII